MSNRIYNLVLVLALTVCVLAVASAKMVGWDDALKQLDLLVDVRHRIVAQYVEEPDQQKMIQSAVEGMISSLADPYTTYINPEEMQAFEKDVQGQFSGIGAEVDMHNGRVRIVTPLDGSPAWEAGVLAGDLILEINGEDTKELSLRQAVNKLTGEEGTPVTIKVRHLSGEEQEFTITRSRITTQTVKALRRDLERRMDFMLDPDAKIGYIRMSQFTESTIENLVAAIEDLKSNGAKGLILDLRYNPGGLLTSAVEVSDLFLEPGKRVLSVKGRVVAEKVFNASKEPLVPADWPVTVMVNEFSASASEIVSGALKDNGRAKVIGARTFGKGSVQQVHMLDSDQGALKITNAYYYIPSGRHIQRKADADVWGVDPDDGFYVPMTSDEQRAMLEARRNYDAHEMTESEPPVTVDWLKHEMKDLQLAAALEAMQGRLRDGDWPVVGLEGATQIEKMATLRNLVRQRDMLQERLAEIEADLAKSDTADVAQAQAEPITITVPNEMYAVTENGVTLTEEGERLMRMSVAGEHGEVTIRFEGIEDMLRELEPTAP